MTEHGTPAGPLQQAEATVATKIELSSPLRLCLTTAVAVFAGEVIVMLILSTLSPLPVLAEALLDGLMITAIASPALYFFVFRPLQLHITERRAAEEGLTELNEQLEDRVAGATAELVGANESLRREVEERRQAEHRLAKTNEFVTKVVESAPCMLLIYDIDNMGCRYVNSSVADIIGYTPEEVEAADEGFFDTVLDPDDRAKLANFTREIAQGDSGEVFARFGLRHSDGESRLCRVKLSVFSTTEIGEPLQILMSAIEVEARPDEAGVGP